MAVLLRYLLYYSKNGKHSKPARYACKDVREDCAVQRETEKRNETD